MIKYRFNIAEALGRLGVTSYSLKRCGKEAPIAQGTWTRLKNENTSITLDSLNSICALLDMQPKDILIYEETEEDRRLRQAVGLDE